MKTLKLIKKTKPKEVKARYQHGRKGFILLFKHLVIANKVPEANQLQCLFLALRTSGLCSNKRKRQVIQAAFPQLAPKKLKSTLKEFRDDGPNKGIVGGGKASLVQDLKSKSERRRFWNFLLQVNRTTGVLKADQLVRSFGKPPKGIAVGVTSSFLYALRPQWYPILNGGCDKGMAEYFINFRKPRNMNEYIDVFVPILRKELETNLKGLGDFDLVDFFFHIAPNCENSFSDLETRKYLLGVESADADRGYLSAMEGQVKIVSGKQRSRSRVMRNRVLLDRGHTCEICGFDFLDTYGVEYAQVHHNYPISHGSRITELKDLTVVCPNCHVMLHHTKFAGNNDLKRVVMRLRKSK